MKILILTSSTGGGHDMRARALKEWVEREKEGEVIVHQALESTHGLYRFGVRLYNFIQKRAPVLHHIYFNYLELAGMLKTSKRMLGKERFKKVLREVKPDVIVSVHGSLNHGFFEIARKVLDKVKCVTYCGELFGGYGFSKHWVNPEADLFIGAMDETCEAAKACGMLKNRTWTGGFLLRPYFWDKEWEENEKNEFIERALGFDPKKMILVLGTGAVGANNHLSFLRALRFAGADIQVVALCGMNVKLLQKVNAWAKRNPQFPVKALGYTDDMLSILRAASAMVARPGTGTTSEAILAGCPIIFNGVGGIMPQEWITVKFFRKRGIAHVVNFSSDLAQIIKDWSYEPQKLKEVKLMMEQMRPRRTPVDIIQKLREV